MAKLGMAVHSEDELSNGIAWNRFAMEENSEE